MSFFVPNEMLTPTDLRHREWLPDLVLGATYGVHLVLDLTGCDPQATNSHEAVSGWNVQLCAAIGMSRYGPPFVATFGLASPKTAGVSLLQPIETSNLAYHEVPGPDGTSGACIDVFSCKLFDPQVAVAVSVAVFGGDVAAMTMLVRGIAPGWR